MERLRSIRESKGIRQKELAELLDVSIVTIARYESGEREPSNANLVKLADFFNVSTDYLLGRVPMDVKIVNGDPPPKTDDETEIVITPDSDVSVMEKLIVDLVEKALKKRGL